MPGRYGRAIGIAAFVLGGCLWLRAQEAIQVPDLEAAAQVAQPVAQRFSFASDGPIGPGWTRPDEISRFYAQEDLPTLFRRTVVLDEDVPAKTRLSWIFTGPHAGLTVELSANSVHVSERYYDSMGLGGSGNYPQRVVREDERTIIGHARRLTVVVDRHLAATVLVNDKVILTEPLVFDLTRHQLMFSGPRNQHYVLAGALLAEPLTETQVTVAPGKLYQTMLGFGGSPSIPAYHQLSEEGRREYWQILRRYNLLIDREYPMGTQLKPDLSNVEDLKDATPHYYGDNFPNGEVSDFDYSRATRALGGSVLYEMWALPRWATDAYTLKGEPIYDAWNKPVKTAAKPEVYAKIVVEFCRRAKVRSGAAPEIVGIQNEVEQPPEVFAAMTVAVRKALDDAGFRSTRIQMADAPYVSMAIGRTDDLKRYKQAWDDTDFIAAHQYDFQGDFANPDLFDSKLRALETAGGGKPFLATEICLNDPKLQEPSYRLAFGLGQLYQKDLTEADAEMLLYCWLLLDTEQPTFMQSRALLLPDRAHGEMPVASSFQLRVLGAFSRHVPKGMRRVESTTDNPDLLTVAFAQGDQHSLVAMNRSTTAQRLHVTWAGVHWTKWEVTSFYSENQEGAVPADPVVQPGEIVTLSDFAAPQ